MIANQNEEKPERKEGQIKKQKKSISRSKSKSKSRSGSREAAKAKVINRRVKDVIMNKGYPSHPKQVQPKSSKPSNSSKLPYRFSINKWSLPSIYLHKYLPMFPNIQNSDIISLHLWKELLASSFLLRFSISSRIFLFFSFNSLYTSIISRRSYSLSSCRVRLTSRYCSNSTVRSRMSASASPSAARLES